MNSCQFCHSFRAADAYGKCILPRVACIIVFNQAELAEVVSYMWMLLMLPVGILLGYSRNLFSSQHIITCTLVLF